MKRQKRRLPRRRGPGKRERGKPRSKKIDDWEQFRDDDVEPIGIDEFKRLHLEDMPHDVQIWILDDYFPEASVWREDDWVICEIEEHLYTKYWEHKFSACTFADAMIRAVRRLEHEGHPLANPSRDDDDDVHIFVRWQLKLSLRTPSEVVTESIKAAFDLVWQRADSMLEDSDSVLLLGKDTGAGLARLKRIESKLQDLGYYPYIIKERPNRLGESVIQKVLRYALSSKFVLIENTEASGHLYEFPHVAKDAECVTVVLQEEGRGATWMFEDAYAKHRHWHRIAYSNDELERAVEAAVAWAEAFVREFAEYQLKNLPWLKKH